MKKNKIIFLLIILILLNSKRTYAEDKLIIAGDENYPPYEYIDEDGQYVGFNIDIMKAISIEMGKEFKIIPMEWMEAHNKLLNGEIDAIQGMSFNEERKEIYNFSDSYLEDELMLFTLKGNYEINSLTNLKGKKVSVQRHSLGSYILSDMGEIEVNFTDDLEESFHYLEQGKVDAILANKVTALNIVKKLKMQNKIKILNDNIATMPYGVAFNKENNEELIKEFNLAIENIKANGTYQKIYNKWFGEITDLKYAKSKKAVKILFIFIFTFILISLIMFKFNMLLRKKVEERTKEIENNKKLLLDSYLYQEQIINSMGSGIIIINNKGYITDLNEKVEYILDLNLEDNMNIHYKDSEILNYFSEKEIQKTIKTCNTFNSLEQSTSVRGRNLIYVYDILPFLDQNNKPIGILLVVKDLTELSILRKRLIQKDKLESLGMLMSSIAHEIRNPLTAIKNYIEMLPVKYDNEKFRGKITEQLPNEINRLDNLLTDLLNYSKPKEFKKENWNLKDNIEDILVFLDPNIKEKSIEVDVRIPKKVYIYSDKQQVRQVIINILLNSIDAVDEKGRIKIYSNSPFNKTILTIEDNGIGISPEDLKDIFNPFFTTKNKGTGLGLSTSYNIMKKNNGRININPLENGTKVDLIFYNQKKGGLCYE